MNQNPARPRIGIDLGGTKIEGILIGSDGTMLARQRMPTPAGNYDATLDAVAEMVDALQRTAGKAGPASVGVGMPGAISPATGLIKNANSTWLNGRPFDRDLTARLGQPVRVANDANCFAVSEAQDGAAAGLHTVFGVILGTGVGGGIAIEGRALTGANAIAGEWGHNPLPTPLDYERPGPLCYCGRHGCIETWVSGAALSRDHRAATGKNLDGSSIVARTEAGDKAAEATLERYMDRLARSLALVINILDPDAIVLGGGLSAIPTLYERVPELWMPHVFSDGCTTRLLRPKHGAASGVRGAAWLWPVEA
jgi:fructokinase